MSGLYWPHGKSAQKVGTRSRIGFIGIPPSASYATHHGPVLRERNGTGALQGADASFWDSMNT
jgi:hypothetical protein